MDNAASSDVPHETPELALVIVATMNYSVLRDFYLRAFEASVEVDVPVYCEMRIRNMRLGVYEAGAFTGNLDDGVRVRPSRAGRVNPLEIYFYSDDLEVQSERLLQAGAVCLSGPEIRPWGERVVYFRDPDGNVIALAQRPAPIPSRGGTGRTS